MIVNGTRVSDLSLVAANSPDYGKSVSAQERQQLPAGGKVSPPQSSVDDLRGQLIRAADIMADLVDNLSLDSELLFQVDESTGTSIITVLDGQTGEVIRRFPSEESLAILHYIAEFENAPRVGLFLNSLE